MVLEQTNSEVWELEYTSQLIGIHLRSLLNRSSELRGEERNSDTKKGGSHNDQLTKCHSYIAIGRYRT